MPAGVPVGGIADNQIETGLGQQAQIADIPQQGSGPGFELIDGQIALQDRKWPRADLDGGQGSLRQAVREQDTDCPATGSQVCCPNQLFVFDQFCCKSSQEDRVFAEPEAAGFLDQPQTRSLQVLQGFIRCDFNGVHSLAPLKTKRESARPSLICWENPDQNQPAEMAETGHADSQAPQSMQVSASITYWLAPAEIAPVGHSPSQAPQEIQASEIL